MNIRTLVADDEPLLARELADFLRREPGVEVVAECLNGPEAVAAIRELRPELAFLDIQMPGLDGFQVLEELDGAHLPLVVFVTAYDQYALQAFAVHALDYLLKPVDPEALHAALERVRAILLGRSPLEAVRHLQAALGRLEQARPEARRFMVREGSLVTFVKVEEVEAIEATGKYMHLHCEGRSHMIRETMATLELRLAPDRFLRTHRSWLVNRDCIQAVRLDGDRTAVLVLRSGRRVPLSRHHHEALERLTGSTLVE